MARTINSREIAQKYADHMLASWARNLATDIARGHAQGVRICHERIAFWTVWRANSGGIK